MAHRKPLGTTFTGTLDWQGPKPDLLDYLVSLAGTWYRVVGIQEKASARKVGLTLERVAAPDGADYTTLTARDEDGVTRLVHPFEWYSRERRRAA